MHDGHYTLNEAAALFPSRPCRKTLTHWIRHGIAGVKLKAVYSGGRVHVSAEAAREFLEAVTAAKLPPAPPPQPETAHHREKRLEAVREKLRRDGFKI